MTDPCEIPRCRAEADLIYMGHSICNRHWDEFTNPKAPPDALKVVLGIGEAHEIQEDPVMSKKSTKQQKPATETKATPKAKRERKEQEPMRTVAMRIPEEEFQLLHKAAGPRNLAGFMRTTLIAAAQKSLAK